MQFLLNRDGSLPPGTNLTKLIEAGARLTLPVDPPTPVPGTLLVDLGDGEEVNGIRLQKWTLIPEPEETPSIPNLNQSQFTYLLAISGLETLWDTLEANLKVSNSEMYAMLRGSRARGSFQFEETLRLVNLFSPYLPEGSPTITGDFLKPLWAKALIF